MTTTKERFHILSLSGGGFRGLYTAQILALIERDCKTPLARKFDLLAGTSIGGILSLGLAMEIPAQRMVDLFVNHGATLFKRRSRVGLFSSPYSSDGLRKLISQPDLFGERTLADCLHPVIVPAFNYTTGQPVAFKTPHHFTGTNMGHIKLVDVALATSAAPLFFPRHVIGEHEYLDGGLCMNAPGQLALHDAEIEFEQPLSSIGLLSVGTMSERYQTQQAYFKDGGLFDWGVNNVLDVSNHLCGITITGQEYFTDLLLRQRLGNRYLHVDDAVTAEQSRIVGLDKTSNQAKQVLLSAAQARFQQLAADKGYRRFMSKTQ